MHGCIFIVKIKLPNSKGFTFQSLWEEEGETELLQGNMHLLPEGWGGSSCMCGAGCRAVFSHKHCSLFLFQKECAKNETILSSEKGYVGSEKL